jgi:hypothetical protein
MSEIKRTTENGNPRISNPAKELMSHLAEKWQYFRYSFDKPIRDRIKPGQTFNSLSETDKEILRGLTSEDIKDVRWPR